MFTNSYQSFQIDADYMYIFVFHMMLCKTVFNWMFGVETVKTPDDMANGCYWLQAGTWLGLNRMPLFLSTYILVPMDFLQHDSSKMKNSKL